MGTHLWSLKSNLQKFFRPFLNIFSKWSVNLKDQTKNLWHPSKGAKRNKKSPTHFLKKEPKTLVLVKISNQKETYLDLFDGQNTSNSKDKKLSFNKDLKYHQQSINFQTL